METNRQSTLEEAAQIEQKKADMLRALPNHHCIASLAAISSGIEIAEHYHWLKTDENYRKQVEITAESMVDNVEKLLYDLIEQKNITAIIFYLKTRGRHRGYEQKEYQPAQQWPSPVDSTHETKAETQWRTSL